MKIKLQPTPKSDGCIGVLNEPDATDPNIEFWRDGKLVATALRNGHHLSWNPPHGKVQAFLWSRMGRHGIKARLCLATYKMLRPLFWPKWESHTKPYVLYYYGCKSANHDSATPVR